VFPAPYIIVGYFVPPDLADAAGVIADIEQQLGTIATDAPLSVPGAVVLRATTANMQGLLDDVANTMVNINEANGGVVRWFAQLCDEPWFATE
jgi:hypothetical protein